MALAQTLECKKRDLKNKGYLNEMKRNQWIPAVVYGKGKEAMPIFLGMKQLTRVFKSHGSRGLFSLKFEGEDNSVTALVRELQQNPLSGQFIHVDFLTVNMEEQIHSTVGILISGEEEVMKKGGILQAGTKEVEVSCLGKNLPEYLTCDISELEIGQKIVVADLKVPEGVEIISEPESVVVLVLAPSRATEEDEEETGEAEGNEAEASE